MAIVLSECDVKLAATVRRGLAAAALSALLIPTFSAPYNTAAQASRVAARYTGTTVNLNPGAGETLQIDVLRWSSAEDAEKLLAALKEKGDSGASAALNAAGTVGIIWTSGSALGYSMRYAHHIPLPDGGERIILATNDRLGRLNQWKATGQAVSPDYLFTVIELRVNRAGVGEGKMSLTSKISADDAVRTIALASYASSPVLLKMTKRELPGGSPPTRP